MNYTKQQSWERFQKYYIEFPEIGLAIDLSRMNVDENFFVQMEPAFKRHSRKWKNWKPEPQPIRIKIAWSGITGCEIQNLPTPEISNEIQQTIIRIKEFSAKIHSGQIHGSGGPFKNYLLIGIGGSALGPQFVANALGDPRTDKLKPYFFDNTDPDGMNYVLAKIGHDLCKTLCIVISKSGGIKEK